MMEVEIMYLYGINRADEIFRIPLLKETPKGYKVESTPRSYYRKFIRKEETGWFFFEHSSLAKAYMRDILKTRVCYAYVALQEAKKKLNKAKEQILDFDQRHGVELDATSDEAHINTKDYKVYNIGRHIFVEELGLAVETPEPT